jgi:hypothetical protein
VFLAEGTTGVLPLLSLDSLRQNLTAEGSAPPAGARTNPGGAR